MDDRGYRDLKITVNDGLQINVQAYLPQNGGGTPVVCLPGLSRTARDFHPLAVHLSTHRQRPRAVYSIDLRGRGKSDHDPDWRHYSPVVEAQDVLDVLVALSIGPAIFVGTSRGGIVTMLIAAMRPGALKGAVLNDIGPEIDMLGLARIKNYLDAPERRPRNWEDAVKTARATQGAHFPGFTDADWEEYTRMTYAEDREGPYRDFDPRLMKTMADLDFEKPAPAMWAQFAALRNLPVMVIRGETSDLLSAETIEKMDRLHPGLSVLEVPGQGHAPMLTGSTILSRIASFATQVDGRTTGGAGKPGGSSGA
ncbi:MAG: alpha/beta fold hydrolase [Flavobacteriaceae bacterium]